MTKALNYFQKAALEGYLDGYMSWGEIYKDGLGVEQNYPQAMETFTQGAEKGSASCLYAQGYLHYKGFGVPRSRTNPFVWRKVNR